MPLKGSLTEGNPKAGRAVFRARTIAHKKARCVVLGALVGDFGG